MKKVRLAVAAGVAAAVIVPLSATGASAAPPNNDMPGGAVALTLGQTYSEDTTQATTGSLDAKMNGLCGAPFTNASVWFTYTPTESGTFLLDMSASSYTGGFMIFANKVDLQQFRGCGPETIAGNAVAGKKYIIVAFSDTATNGGDLEVSLQPGPPPPTGTVTINPDGKAYSNGDAQISGTMTCANADGGYAENYGTLTQIWKRLKITGFYDQFNDPSVCDGTSHAWKTRISSDNGLYANGNASVTGEFDVCGLIECIFYDYSNVSVNLHGKADGARAGTGLKPTVTVTTKARGVLNWKGAPVH